MVGGGLCGTARLKDVWADSLGRKVVIFLTSAEQKLIVKEPVLLEWFFFFLVMFMEG